MNKPWFLFIALAFAALLPLSVSGQIPADTLLSGFDSFSLEEGVPGPTIYALAQGRDRMVWIGGENGLVAWDGQDFRPWDNQALPHPNVLDLFVDALGELWVATVGGIARVRPTNGSTETFVPPADKPGMPTAPCWRFGQLDDGTMVVGTLGQGLLALDAKTGTWSTMKAVAESGLSGKERILSIHSQTGHPLWLSSFVASGYLDGSGFHEVQLLRADGTKTPFGVFAFYRDKQGRLLAAFQGGVALWDAEAGVFREHAAMATGGKFMVRAFGEDDAGRLWVGADNGVRIYQGDRLVSDLAALPRNGRHLPGSWTNRILADSAGGMILGLMQGGIARWDPWMQPVSTLHFGRGDLYEFAERETITAVAARDGEVWFATNQSHLVRLSGGKAEPVPVSWPVGTPRTLVLTLALTRDHLWLGTGQELYRMSRSNRSVIQVDLGTPGPSGTPVAAYHAQVVADTLWLASVNRGIGKVIDGPVPRVEWQNAVPLKSDGSISRLELVRPAAAPGWLWLGGEAGLVYWHPESGRSRVYSLAIPGESLAKLHYIHDIASAGTGVVWIASEAGLLRMDLASGNVQVRRPPGINTAVSSLVRDSRGDVWTGTPAGWFRYRPSIDAWLRIGKFEGLVSDMAGLRTLLELEDGTLFMGGLRGVSLLDAARLRPVERALQASVGTVLVDDAHLVPGPGGELAIPAGTQRLEVRLHPHTYRYEQEIAYEVRLEGFDREFRTVPGPVLTFTNIPPGDYRLLVRLRLNGRLSSAPPLALPLRVAPTFIQSPWFYVVLVLLAGGMGMGIAAWRTRRIQAFNLRLQEEVSRQTREIDTRNEELSAANHNLRELVHHLEETRGQLAEAEKLAAMGRMVAGLAHEFNTPLGTGITAASFLNDSLAAGAQGQGVDRENLRASSELLVRSLERMAHLVQILRSTYLDGWVGTRQRLSARGVLEHLRSRLDASLQSDYGPVVEYQDGDGEEMELVLEAVLVIGETLARNALIHGYGSRRGQRLLVSLHCEGKVKRLGIRDWGCGIAADELAKIKEPFYKVQRTSQGFGMGLTIAWLLARNVLGGDLQVESQPGEGTVVWVEW